MTYEQPFERRLAAWLADGPVEAPEWAIDAAVDHAYRHPRRRGALRGWGRALMAGAHLTPVVLPAHRAWVTAAASAVVVLVAGLTIVGGSGLLNQRPGNAPAAASGSTSPAAPLPTVTSAPWISPSPDDPIHVTGSFDQQHGSTCTISWCEFFSVLVASDGRLNGPFALDTGGGTTAGAFGTAAFYQPGTSLGWAITIAKVPEDKLTWDGEWFTAGARSVGIGSGPNASDIDSSSIWPVDTIWLHGRNANSGLTALLRLTDQGTLDGWIFNTPASH